ncbi:MAG: ornithine cyclodeaminase family protein [Desulfobacteraceae bacterium]|nr:ornithine cyclodeaminase family protein [Desulfobacteraceae bacterium]
MIFLNKNHMGRIKRQFIQDAVENAYEKMRENNYNMPDRMHVGDNDNTLLLMPCFSGDFFSTKLVSIFPDALKYNEPAINGVLVLNDNATGKPLAVMDGAALTAERTGAVGGLGVKYLTSDDIETAGIFGAGVQGLSQAKYLLLNRTIKRLYLNSKSCASAQKLAADLEKEFAQTQFIVLDNPEKLVKESQVVIGATTSSIPVFKADDIDLSNKTFIAIGSFKPDMQEFPNEVIVRADEVYVDTLHAAKESGDIAIPLKNNLIEQDKIVPFSNLTRKIDFFNNNTYLFKSVGMALFDLTVATAVFRMAQKENIGQKLDF